MRTFLKGTQPVFMEKKILLIDGYSILNRAFYALPVLTNSHGEYTNAVYGFLNIFFKFLDEEQPDYAAVALDLHAPTFRHNLFSDYKGTRKAMPEELRPQVDLLKNLLALMRIRVYAHEGYEADDILGTIAYQAERMGLKPIVITGDRDLLQITTNSIKVRIPKTKQGKTEVEDYYAKDVFDKLGVTPLEYIDVKALMGDASDNIPGAPGIGEKTAVKLIQTYKTLENCLAHADEVKPARASASLIENRELIMLSKRLSTISKDAPVQLNINETGLQSIYSETAMAEIVRLECKSILPRFSLRGQLKNDAVVMNRRIARTESEAAVLFDGLINAGAPTSFKLIFNDDNFIGISFAYYTPQGIASMFFLISDHFKTYQLLDLCGTYFASGKDKLTHDVKTAMSFLHKREQICRMVIFDTMLAGYILNASKPTYEISDIMADFLKEIGLPEEAFWGKGKTKRNILLIPEEELTAYACRQAETIIKSYPIMRDKLIENGQKELYEQIELPLAETLSDMELAGIKVNREQLINYGYELQKHIDRLTHEIYSLAGENFNINSPAQLRVILYEKLELKSGKKTKQGYSTAAEALEKLKNDHPIINKILEYRTYAKLKSTYADGLLNAIDPETSKIYSTFNQTITSTGRISSQEPNLQNIPIRMELGRELRKAFIPSDDSFIFVDADYSQIELRVLAHLSGDEALISAFEEGQDIHRLTASQAFKIPFDQVTPEQRGAAKAVNFGIVYGISSFSLSQDLNISKREAEKYINGYFEKYPKVKQYLDNVILNARKDGYAVTVFGRRRRIPELKSSNFIDRSFGERVAMNMPVQGTAADIIKIAMIRVSKRLKLENKESRLILQVHDELLLEVKRSELEAVSLLLKEEMENAVHLSVPMQTELHIGETWYDAK